MLNRVLSVMAFVAVSSYECCGLRLGLVSDTHYDPGYGTSRAYRNCGDRSAKYGKAGCDSPAALVTSLERDMRGQSIDTVILAGDIQRHKFGEGGFTIDETFGFVLRSAAQVPQSSVFVTGANVTVSLGNNDMVPNYYFDIEKQNEYLIQEYKTMRASGTLDESEKGTFLKCGYYLRKVSSRLRIIVLNTILWCHCSKAPIPDSVADPCGQMNFLRKSLEEASLSNARVIILSHVPPYVDLWKVLKRGSFASAQEDMYWKPVFQERYHDIVSEYNAIVVAQLFGHTHKFFYQVVKSKMVSFVIPALTPLYANVPSYLIADVDHITMKINSMRQRFIINGEWRDGDSLESLLGHPNNPRALSLSASRLKSDDALWKNWSRLHSGGILVKGLFPKGECDAWCRRVVSCSMTNSAWKDIKFCVHGETGTSAAGIHFAVALLGVPVFPLLLLTCL
uniref:WGS project CAEQ00000000 data, annotated contig 254 n=1 Tax=Trypanosoma congolense (strain IL3000) TaxID=1068625 RepID=F9WEE1_TRYCI|nr:unnamed protein product [Trypanosoma congolense IL3000]